MNSILFFVGACVIGGITMYLKSLIQEVLDSDIKHKKEVDIVITILIFIVMFGGVAILYRYCPPF